MTQFVPARWQKLGIVIAPDSSNMWNLTHAMMPTPEHVEGSLWRIYFGGRNEKNQSYISWVLIDLAEPDRILERCTEPVLCPGPLGTFDDNGVLPSCIVKDGEETLMYYIGFKPGGTTRMDLFGGLASRRLASKGFNRLSRAPILERNHINPYINTAPWVVRDGCSWRMYYVAGTEWVNRDLPRYNIQIATSDDGRNWVRDGKVAVDFGPEENALARPYVYRSCGKWVMWFASKGLAYQACWAISDDGLEWTRLENGPGLETSSSGPDSDMLEYFVVLEHNKQRIVFYNGNNYGRDGICVAIEE